MNCCNFLIILAGASVLASSQILDESVPDASGVSFFQAGLGFQQPPEVLPAYPAILGEEAASAEFGVLGARLPGCDRSQIYDHHYSSKKFYDPALGKALKEGSANPMHFSTCNRTIAYFDAIENVMKEENWQLPQNPRIISVGCSIGYEAQEARARFPTAEEIACYDLDAGIIAEGKAATDPSYNITFTANRDDLMEHSFDIVLINNVLFSHMSPEEFSGFMGDVLSWPKHENALFEIMVYSNDHPGMKRAPGKSGMMTKKSFDENVAWQQLFRTFEDSSKAIRFHSSPDTPVSSRLFFAKW